MKLGINQYKSYIYPALEPRYPGDVSGDPADSAGSALIELEEEEMTELEEANNVTKVREFFR